MVSLGMVRGQGSARAGGQAKRDLITGKFLVGGFTYWGKVVERRDTAFVMERRGLRPG